MLSSKPKHCTSTQLEVIDYLHREEIEILNDFMRVLPNSDDDQIVEWLQRLEGQVLHHSNEEESCVLVSNGMWTHTQKRCKPLGRQEKTGMKSEI